MRRQKPLRTELHKRHGDLKNERSSWESHWHDISRVLLPRNGRFFTTDRNRGERRHNDIYDSTATRALRAFSAGMMSMGTSQARPWFALTVADPDIANNKAVEEWLDDTASRIRNVFNAPGSNVYPTLHQMYDELGAFGTSAAIIEQSFDSVIRLQPVTIGEYCIATDHYGRVDTFYREYEITVRQCVAQFGRDACSDSVQRLYGNGQLDAPVTIVHAIEPRKDRDPTRLDSLEMPWRSIYYERDSRSDKILRESGFRRFPVLCPRWMVAGGDVYGTSPGMEALGDIRQLQHEQLRKGEVIDYKTKPPLSVPSSLKQKDIDILPGGLTFHDLQNANSQIRPAFEANLELNYLLEDIQDVRRRIESAFFVDVLLMINRANDTTEKTKYEILVRNEEKFVVLGPAVQRVQNELAAPLVEYVFGELLDNGGLAPVPPELQGQEWGIEFLSVFAQAQRAVGIGSMDRLVNAAIMAANAGKPEVLDLWDADEWFIDYARMLGVSPTTILSKEQVADLRRARADAEKAKEQALMMQQQAQTARDLAAAPTDQPNALTDVMQGLTGYSTGAPA